MFAVGYLYKGTCTKMRLKWKVPQLSLTGLHHCENNIKTINGTNKQHGNLTVTQRYSLMLQEMLSFIMAINAIDGLILNRKTNDYSFIYYSVKRKGLYNVKFSNTFQIPATNFFFTSI